VLKYNGNGAVQEIEMVQFVDKLPAAECFMPFGVARGGRQLGRIDDRDLFITAHFRGGGKYGITRRLLHVRPHRLVQACRRQNRYRDAPAFKTWDCICHGTSVAREVFKAK
jgi:hypothetical protein